MNNKVGIGTTPNNIGEIHRVMHKYNEALEYLNKSLSIQKKVGAKLEESMALDNIGKVFHAKGDYDKAINCYRKSLEIRKEINDRAGEGTTLNNIGQIFQAHGNYDTALKYQKRSLSIKQEIGDRSGVCVTLFNMGRIHKQNDEMPEAISNCLAAYVLASEMKLAESLNALTNLAPQLGIENGLSGWQKLLEEKQARGWKNSYL